MSVLNNIWLVLSAPNEFLINAYSIFLEFFIEAPLSLMILTTVLKFETTKKQKITYIVLISIISLLTSFFVPSPFNIIINYLL